MILIRFFFTLLGLCFSYFLLHAQGDTLDVLHFTFFKKMNGKIISESNGSFIYQPVYGHRLTVPKVSLQNYIGSWYGVETRRKIPNA